MAEDQAARLEADAVANAHIESLREELDSLADQCNEGELQALLFVARRVAKGRELYGPLSEDKRDNWLQEAAEEMADGLVYFSMEELRRAKK